jgi:hypothetical protein
MDEAVRVEGEPDKTLEDICNDNKEVWREGVRACTMG